MYTDETNKKNIDKRLYKEVEDALNNRILKIHSKSPLTYKDVFESRVKGEKSKRPHNK